MELELLDGARDPGSGGSKLVEVDGGPAPDPADEGPVLGSQAAEDAEGVEDGAERLFQEQAVDLPAQGREHPGDHLDDPGGGQLVVVDGGVEAVLVGEHGDGASLDHIDVVVHGGPLDILGDPERRGDIESQLEGTTHFGRQAPAGTGGRAVGLFQHRVLGATGGHDPGPGGALPGDERFPQALDRFDAGSVRSAGVGGEHDAGGGGRDHLHEHDGHGHVGLVDVEGPAVGGGGRVPEGGPNLADGVQHRLGVGGVDVEQ